MATRDLKLAARAGALSLALGPALLVPSAPQAEVRIQLGLGGPPVYAAPPPPVYQAAPPAWYYGPEYDYGQGYGHGGYYHRDHHWDRGYHGHR